VQIAYNSEPLEHLICSSSCCQSLTWNTTWLQHEEFWSTRRRNAKLNASLKHNRQPVTWTNTAAGQRQRRVAQIRANNLNLILTVLPNST